MTVGYVRWLGLLHERPRSGRLTQQAFLFAQFWRLEVQDPRAGKFGPR